MPYPYRLILIAVGLAAIGYCWPATVVAQSEVTPCEDARIVARVGSEVVLASEVITLFVRDALDKFDAPIPAEERMQLIKKRLRYHVELKMILLDAKRTIPEEGLARVKENIGKYFDKKEIPAMMKITKTGSRQELDEKLHRLGTSLYRQKLVFIERALAMEWMRQQVEVADPVTHEKMLEYYHEHLADYEHLARARWEELAVKVSADTDKTEAHARIAHMGNLVQDGAPFSQVAKNGSEGITSARGGVRDWTTQGSLVSETIDEAIFSLPVGTLSPILQSSRGFHIVRVIQRKDAYRTPFEEAQGKIRKTIERQQSSQGRNEYLTKLQKSTKVWTMFDKPKDQSRLQANRQSLPVERARQPR